MLRLALLATSSVVAVLATGAFGSNLSAPGARALRRVRLIVRLIAGRQTSPHAGTPTDALEHQQAWAELSRAAERFHAIVLESRGRPSPRNDQAPER